MGRPSDHFARHDREVHGNVRHPTQVEMRFLQMNMRHFECAFDDLNSLFARHAPLRAVTLLLQRAGPMHRNTAVNYGSQLRQSSYQINKNVKSTAVTHCGDYDARKLVS